MIPEKEHPVTTESNGTSAQDQVIAVALLQQLQTAEHIQHVREALATRLRQQILCQYPHSAAEMSIAGKNDQANENYHLCLTLGIDILFYTFPNKPAFITLPMLSGTSNERQVTPCQVAGIIFPLPGERVESTYERAALCERRLVWSVNRTLAFANGSLDFHPRVAIADPDHLSLWIGEQLPEQTTHPKVELSTARLCQVLTNGLDTVLGKGAYRLQINALETHEYEVSVCTNDGTLLELDCVGLARKPTQKKLAIFEEVSNVVGFRCNSIDLTDAARIEKSRRDMKGMRTRRSASTHTKKAKVLSVTQDLVNRWENLLATGANFCQLAVPELGESEWEHHPANEELPKTPEQGRVTRVRYVTHEQGPPSIGAKPSFLEIYGADGSIKIITLDAGAIYEGFSWKGPFKPSITEGIAPFEELLPQVPFWFRLTLLLKKAERQGASFLNIDGLDLSQLNHSHFQLLDIFNRLRPRDFKRFCKALAKISDVSIDDGEIQQLQLTLSTLSADTKFKDKVEHIGFLISHFHDDHIGFAAVVSSEIPQVMSVESLPWIKTFASRGAWQYEVTERIDRSTVLKEGTQERYRPPVLALMPYETRFLGSSAVSVTSLPVDHSIYGMTMFLITIYDTMGLPSYTVLYTGDFRFGDQGLTELTADVLSKIKVDALITDTTNIGSDSTIKPKEKTTPEAMVQQYAEQFQRAKGPVIIQLDPKDLETTYLISLAIAQANKAGTDRHLVYDIRHAAGANLFLQADQASSFFMADLQAQQATAQSLMTQPQDRTILEDTPVNLVQYHPRPRITSNTTINKSGKKQHSPVEQAVISEYSTQMTSFAQLLAKPKQLTGAVILVPPYKSLEQAFQTIADQVHGATVIRSHFFPYSNEDKSKIREDVKFCKRFGWNYESDLVIDGNSIRSAARPRFRMGGHAQQHELLRFIATLYEKNKDMVTIPVHGEHREKAATLLLDAIGKQLGISPRIVSRMRKNEFAIDLL